MLIQAGRVGAVGRTRVALSDTDRLISYMTTRPDATRAGHIATLINTLKSSGVWSKLAVLYLLAAHDAQAATLNWMNPSRNALLLFNSPAITTDRGLQSDGSTSYAQITNFNIANGINAKLTLNDMALGAWITTAATGASAEFAATNSAIYSRTSAGAGNIQTRANDQSTQTTSGLGTVTRLLSWSRLSSTAYKVYYRGAVVASPAIASTVFTSQASFIGRVAGGLYSNSQIGAAFMSAGLTDAEMLALSNALDTYMTAIGAM